jgi:hypothetical protein
MSFFTFTLRVWLLVWSDTRSKSVSRLSDYRMC